MLKRTRFQQNFYKMSYTYRLFIFIFVFIIMANFIYLSHSTKTRLSNSNYINYSNSSASSKLSNSKPIHLLVNYETLCPDSERFIVNQLPRAINIFRENLIVQLIPFGKASYKLNQNNRLYEFDCQHGSRECFGNIIHVIFFNVLSLKYIFE